LKRIVSFIIKRVWSSNLVQGAFGKRNSYSSLKMTVMQ